MLDPWLDLFHGGACVGCSRPGRVLCRDCERGLPVQARRVWPTPCPDGLAACFAAGEYDGVLGRLVVAHKEHAAFALAGPLGSLLASAVSRVIEPEVLTVLVPVPSRPAVVRARGHDPLLRVTRSAARRLRPPGGRVRVLRLLEQRFAVPDQAGLDSRSRATNLRGSLAVRPSARNALAARSRPCSIVVCDDVLTTGATAREAQRALEDSGLRVRAICTVAATRRRLPSVLLP